jgi:enamine deaminase RidA (YjgF/YER057c/UK114 family)
MSTHDLLHPAGWKRTLGYSNGVAASGRTIFLAGQIGWDAEQQFVSDDLVGQAAQALRNIVEVLAEADAGPEHIVRLTWYVIDRDEYLANQTQLGDVYREVIGKHFPAMALVQVVALVESRAKVEIEATAVVP